MANTKPDHGRFKWTEEETKTATKHMYDHGYTYAEIAGALDISEDDVKKYLKES